MKSVKKNSGYRYWLLFLRGLCVFLFLCFSIRPQAQTVAEYNIKAVFLFNFTRFVEWPSNTLPNPDDPFVIGILGDDPFHSYIDETVAGEKVRGHSIVVRRYQSVNDIKDCQIVFISSNEVEKLPEILPALSGKNILTVSDIKNFAATGGMVGFYAKDNKIKMQVNVLASKNADLSISSKLLQVADIIR